MLSSPIQSPVPTPADRVQVAMRKLSNMVMDKGPRLRYRRATGPVRLVVFTADKRSGRVLGLAERTVAR
jgi:hypothetical protein